MTNDRTHAARSKELGFVTPTLKSWHGNEVGLTKAETPSGVWPGGSRSLTRQPTRGHK